MPGASDRPVFNGRVPCLDQKCAIRRDRPDGLRCDRAGGNIIDTQHRRRRILVSLDDSERQTALAARLRAHGHEVVSVADQARALDLLRDHRAAFDLVVMDTDERHSRHK